MRRTWNFYRFSLKDVQGPSVFAARQSSYAPFSTQGDLRLKQLLHFSEEFHRLFVPFFLLRLFYSLQATYQHYRQCSLEVIWRRDWCKTHWMYWMHLCLYHLCLNRLCGWYCWWKKSQTTSWYGKYPITYRVLYIPGGWPWDFFHQHRTLKSGVERRQTMIPKLSLGSLPQRSMKNKTPVALNWMHPKTMMKNHVKPVFFHQNGEIHSTFCGLFGRSSSRNMEVTSFVVLLDNQLG